MSDETQALAFLAGANSIFTGDKLLTTGNPGKSRDTELFERLGIRPEYPRCLVGGATARLGIFNIYAHKKRAPKRPLKFIMLSAC